MVYVCMSYYNSSPLVRKVEVETNAMYTGYLDHTFEMASSHNKKRSGKSVWTCETGYLSIWISST